MSEKTMWKEEYSVGDAIIDSQHQHLIAAMNQLAEIIERSDYSIKEAFPVFGALAIYVLDHFGYEEQRMAQAGYPEAELAQHKSTHLELARQVREFQRRVAKGDAQALRDMLPFLSGTWLTEHICVADQCYGPYLASKAAS